MAWENRNGKRLYYRSRRSGKQVVRDYFGSGDMARLGAGLDDAKRRQSRQDRETITTLRQQWVEACKSLDPLTTSVQALTRASLSAAEIRTQLGMGDDSMQAQHDPVLADLLSVVIGAEAGDTDALMQMRTILKDQPQLVAHFGDIAQVAADLWLSLYAGGNLLIAEATREKMVAWRAPIAGPQPSPLETLMIEQITICWLQSHYAEAMYAQAVAAKASEAVLNEMSRQQGESQQRLTAGIHQLATLRKLLPTKESDVSARPALLLATPSDECTVDSSVT